ncbi:MAG: UTP--glucose-1-phosphate uridylyltransferase GalU [Bacteriovoracia bacterium]
MSTSKRIRKAVIPAAGLGTRFLPATKAVPKEMIPIVDVPMIQLIVQEAVQSGIEEIVLVTGRGKDAIENHFDFNYELEDTLEKKNKPELAKISKDLARMCKVMYVRQKEPLGLGHAVLAAAPLVGDEPFAVLLPDDLIDAKIPCTKQLADEYFAGGKSVVGVMEVAPSEVSKYGIVAGKMIDPKRMAVADVVEKPAAAAAPSRLAIPGRYVLHPRVFDYLRELKPGKIAEIQLTDGLTALARNEGLTAYLYEGDRYDAGDRLGYLEATLVYAMKRPELRDGLAKIVKKYF